MLPSLKSPLFFIPLIVVVLVLIFIGYRYNFSEKREGFQDDATNEIFPNGVPIKLGKEHCRLLNTQIEQYKKTRRDYPDLHIDKLDDIIVQLDSYYHNYSCDKYTF